MLSHALFKQENKPNSADRFFIVPVSACLWELSSHCVCDDSISFSDDTAIFTQQISLAGIICSEPFESGIILNNLSIQILHHTRNSLRLHYRDPMVNAVRRNNCCLFRESYRRYKCSLVGKNEEMLKLVVYIVTTVL